MEKWIRVNVEVGLCESFREVLSLVAMHEVVLGQTVNFGMRRLRVKVKRKVMTFFF